MDEKVFQKRLTELKHEGEEAIRYCREKCEEIYNSHRANDHSLIDNERVLCPTKLWNEKRKFRLCPRSCLCKEARRVFSGHANDLIRDYLETNDPREVMILDVMAHVHMKCCQIILNLKDKLQELNEQRCSAKNENNDEVPVHTNEPVDVECTAETVDDKLMVEAADVECEEVKLQVTLLDGSNGKLDSVGQSLEPLPALCLPDYAHIYAARKEVSISQVAEEKSDDLLCNGEVTEPPDDDVVDFALFKFKHQASNMCPPHRKTDPKEGRVKYLGLAKKPHVRKDLDKNLIMKIKPHRKIRTKVLNGKKLRVKWLLGKKAVCCMKIMPISAKIK